MHPLHHSIKKAYCSLNFKKMIFSLIVLVMLQVFITRAQAEDAWFLENPTGTCVACIDSDGNLELAGRLLQNQTEALSDDESINSFTIAESSEDRLVAYHTGDFAGDLKISGVLHEVADPPTENCLWVLTNAASTVVASLDLSGNLWIKGYLQPTAARRDKLPTSITAHISSPIFPTPGYYLNLPQQFLDKNGTNGSEIAGLSAMQLEALFVYRPNMNWDETSDHDYNQATYYNTDDPLNGTAAACFDRTDANMCQIVNTIGDWFRPTQDENGGLYACGDNAGVETGRAQFNRFQWEDETVNSETRRFVEQHKVGAHQIGRINNMVPGVYQKMLTSENPDQSEDIYGEVVSWHCGWQIRSKKYYPNPNGEYIWVSENANLFDIDGGGADGPLVLRPDDQRFERPIPPSGSLFIGGAYYGIYNFRPTFDYSWIAFPQFSNFYHVKNLQNFIPNIFTSSANGGNWWAGELYDPATNTFSSMYPSPYNPDYESTYDTDFNAFCQKHIWANGKFTVAGFIQFGAGYLDYEGHEPDPNVSSNVVFSRTHLNDSSTKVVYVYAMSPYMHWANQDAMYLGRCRLQFSTTNDVNHNWGTWNYYKGIDVDGNPIWTTEIDEAKSVLWAKGEMAAPSIIFEKNTGLYIMTTHTLKNSIEYSHINGQYYVWVAKKPWGPWRKVLANDYNGLQYKCAQDIRQQEGGYYDVGIMPTNIEYEEFETEAGITEKVRVWMMTGGCWNQSICAKKTQRAANFDLYNTGFYRAWDEHFKGTYYTPSCWQVEIVLKDEDSYGVPAVAQYTVPNYRMEDLYDHWAVEPFAPRSSGTFFEAESLSPSVENVDNPTVESDANASGGGYVLFDATSTSGSVTFNLSGVPAGMYVLNFRATKSSEMGLWAIEVKEGTGDFARLGVYSKFHSDSASLEFTQTRAQDYMTEVSWLITTGSNTSKYVKFICAGNIGSNDKMGIDYIELVPRLPKFKDDNKLGPFWVGTKFKTGPSPVKVTKLGRYYMTGNTRSHALKIVDENGNQVQNANATVSMLKSSAENKPRFDASDKVSQNGFVYGDVVGDVYLNANTNYYLLSREGLDDSETANHLTSFKRYSAAEDCVVDSSHSVNNFSGYIGFRFRTGPMGMRITHVMRMKTEISGQRDFIIEKATTNPDQDVQPFNVIDPGELVGSAQLSESSSLMIGNGQFAYCQLSSPIDLLPSTEYYIGTKIESGDVFYGVNPKDTIDTGISRYDEMPKMRFNPNMLQFIYPAYKDGANGSWESAASGLLPLMGEGEDYDDGVGIIPPVWGPINFLCEVPDRFEGYRNNINRANESTGDNYVAMPILDTVKMRTDFQLLNSVFFPRSTECSPANWEGGYEEYLWSPMHYGEPNSCPGPIDFTYTLVNSSTLRVQDDSNYTDSTGPKFSNASHLLAAANRNRFFVQGMKKYSSGYSGMQLKVGAEPIQITQIGRYFSSGSGNDHHVMVMEQGPNIADGIVAYGTIAAPSSAGWAYATTLTTHPDAESPWLKPGHIYYILCYENYVSSDPPYGAPDDFGTLRSGSSVTFLGPAYAANATPLSPHYIKMTDSNTANPQSYGPLNMIFEPVNSSWVSVDLTLLASNPTGTLTYSTLPWSGYHGYKFKTGAKPVMVTELGRYQVDGTGSKQHHVILQRCRPAPLDKLNSGTGSYSYEGVLSELVASVIVDNSASNTTGYVYSKLEQPVVLEPNTEYYLASYENYSSSADDRYILGSSQITLGTSNAHFGYTDTSSFTGVWCLPDNGNTDPNAWAILSGYSFTANVNLKIK